MQIQYYKQGHLMDAIVLLTILCKQTKIRFKTLKFENMTYFVLFEEVKVEHGT